MRKTKIRFVTNGNEIAVHKYNWVTFKKGEQKGQQGWSLVPPSNYWCLRNADKAVIKAIFEEMQWVEGTTPDDLMAVLQHIHKTIDALAEQATSSKEFELIIEN